MKQNHSKLLLFTSMSFKSVQGRVKRVAFRYRSTILAPARDHVTYRERKKAAQTTSDEAPTPAQRFEKSRQLFCSNKQR